MKKEPNKVKGLRRCVGCRLMFDKQELIRIAKCPDGSFYVDKSRKPFGRGAYICFNARCILRAAKLAMVERSFGIKDKTADVNKIYEHLATVIEDVER